MTTNDYSIEEMENAAVKKSNIVKKVGISAALIAGGAAAAAAATMAMDDNTTMPEDANIDLSTEDVAEVAQSGVTSDHTPENNHSYSEVTEEPVTSDSEPEPYPEPEPEPETSVTIDSVTNIYDGDDKVGSVQTGTINGMTYQMVDTDGDGLADDLYVDQDGNGRYDDNEHLSLDDSDGIRMASNADTTNNVVYVHDNEVSPAPDDISHDNDIANDFIEENSNEYSDDEKYSDFAYNNSDYDNHADVSNYMEASVEYNEDHDMALDDNHDMNIGEDHDMAFDDDHDMNIGEDHDMAFDDDHDMNIGEDHDMAFDDDHDMNIGEDHDMAFDDDHDMMLDDGTNLV